MTPQTKAPARPATTAVLRRAKQPGTALVPVSIAGDGRRSLSKLTVAGMAGGVGATRCGDELARALASLDGARIAVDVLDCVCATEDLLASTSHGRVVLVCRPDQVIEAATAVQVHGAAVSGVIVNQLTPHRLSRPTRLQIRSLRGRVDVAVLPHVRRLARRDSPARYRRQMLALAGALQESQSIVADMSSATR